MPLTYPQLLAKAFASNAASPTYGGKNTIPSGAASPLASLDDGFPLATMTPISGGGTPPAGKDMNGILWLITQFQAWTNAGGRFKYDSTLATAMGGYPAGAVLMLSDNVSEVICVTAGTTTDPNVSMTGWAPYAGSLSGAGFYQLDTGAVNAYVVARAPLITSYKNGMAVLFKAIHTNTAASTLDAGGGPIPLKRTDGAALLSGDVQNGSVYQAIYDAATTTFVLTNFVQSQVVSSLFAAQTNVTASRVIGTVYTNNTGKPMYVSAQVGVGTGNNSIGLYVGGVLIASDSANSPNAMFVSGIVPPGSTYQVAWTQGTGTLNVWVETY